MSIPPRNTKGLTALDLIYITLQVELVAPNDCVCKVRCMQMVNLSLKLFVKLGSYSRHVQLMVDFSCSSCCLAVTSSWNCSVVNSTHISLRRNAGIVNGGLYCQTS